MTTTGTMQKPDYDLELTDGVNTVGIVVTGNNGKPDPTRLVARPLERMAIQTSVGESKFSDRVMPYRDVSQEDWSGGRGMLVFDDDTSRFYDSENVITDKKGRLILSGKTTSSKTFTSGYGKLFEYKRCLYAINIIDGANSILWMNGDRGAADSNSGDLTKLNDATKGWTPDEFIGATVLIIAGPGSEESQPWRLITDNDATSLTVSPAWAVTHTTSTEYVIVGSERWAQILDLGGHVTDFAIADQFVYFARGETASLNVLRYNEYNNAGTWTARNAAENMAASRIIALRNEAENVTYLYGSLSNNSPYKITVWKQRVPATWAKLYKDIGQVCASNIPWSDRIIANVTNTTSESASKIDIAAGFTTGVAAVKNINTPIDITSGNAIGMMIKSSVATNSGDLRLLLEDQDDLGRSYYSPQKLFLADGSQNPRIIPIPFAADGDTATSEYIKPGYYIYIGGIRPYNSVTVDIATANTVTNTMTFQYYNGQWTTVTITDNTASGGKSFAVDGSITFSLPDDWLASTINGNNQYWGRISFSADVSLGTKVNQINITGDQSYINPQTVFAHKASPSTYYDRLNMRDGNNATNQTLTIIGSSADYEDYIYIGSPEKFNEIKFDISTASSLSSVLSYQFFNGVTWESLVSVTDTTYNIVLGLPVYPLGQDGSITFIPQSNWQKCAVSTTENFYYVRISYIADTFGTNPVIVDITVRERQNPYDPSGLALVKAAADYAYTELSYATDGDTATHESIYIATDMYMYVGASIVFNKVYADIKTANTAAATLTAEYFDGSLWQTVTITDGTASSGKPFAVDGEISFSPENNWQKNVINSVELYWLRIKSSADISFEIYELRYNRSNNINLQIPALAANAWTWVTMSITPTALPIPNEATIKSVGLYVQVDNGAQVVYILDGIRLVYDYTDTYEIKLEGSAKINGFAIYNDAEMKGSNVWCFTEDGAVEIQQDNNVLKIPIGELKELSTERTGQAWAVNNVYLWFALSGLRVEQYYNRTLNDVGPDGDDGMPTTRQGEVSSMISYPGRIFIGIDGGSANYSSILMWRSNAWFDIYVAGSVNKRIRDIAHQEIRGRGYGRLWFSEDNVIKWAYLTPDPQGASDFQYASTGFLYTGKMYANMWDVKKLFHSVKVFGTLDATVRCVVLYRIDNDTFWTVLGTFDSDGEEIDFTYPFPTGKSIQFKLALLTSDETVSPVVTAFVLNTYAFVEVKQEYSFMTVNEDNYMAVDLNYEYHKTVSALSSTSAAAMVILEGWRNNATPLTMRSRFATIDNRYVVINSLIHMPLNRFMPEQKNNLERYLIAFGLMDV